MRKISKFAVGLTSAAMAVSALALPVSAAIVNPNGTNPYNDDQPYYLVDLDEAAIAQGFDLTTVYGFNFYFTWQEDANVGDCQEQLSYNSLKDDGSGSTDWKSIATNLSFKVAEEADNGMNYIQYTSEEALFGPEDVEFAEIQAESYYVDYTVEYVELLGSDGSVIATIQCNGAEEAGAVPMVLVPVLALAASSAVIITRRKK